MSTAPITLRVDLDATIEARANRARDRAIAIGIAALLDEHRPDYEHTASAYSRGNELEIEVEARARPHDVTVTLTRAPADPGGLASQDEVQAP